MNHAQKIEIRSGCRGPARRRFTVERDPNTPPPYETIPHAPSAPPAPKPPALPGQVVVRESTDDLIDAAAADLLFQSLACVRAFGDFHLALSGGSTPEPLYRRLMLDPLYRNLPWKRTHLWIVDERRVPPDDDRSNYKMIRELLVEHSDIPREQVHPMAPMADDADRRYEHELCEHLGWREKGHDRLDFVVLGMGGDGHTASLFPHSPALHEKARLVAINAGPSVTPPDRITMTYTLLNASRFLGVLVTGEKKREAIARVVAAQRAPGADHREELPILGVKPLAGEMRWYLDRAACPAP
jgi:6-phosphogluconolactonase